jgi:hypothetical protein
MKKLIAMGMISVCLASVPTAGRAGPAAWHEYTNVRFGYSFCYPETFAPDPEPASGEGRSFSASDGSSMMAFGEQDDRGLGVMGTAKLQVAAFSQSGAHITYNRVGRDWSVISGVRQEQTFYLKILGDGKRVVTLLITYPRAKAASYRPVVTKIEHCFKFGPNHS